MIDISIIKIINTDIILQKKFYKFLKKIYKFSSKYEIYMGIDFEFNTKKIALMQILFEINKKSKIIKKYYIIYPPILSKKINDFLKYNIMSNTNILKILHGSESLDIPWIVEDFYNYEVEPIIDFFLSMIDTRYLCEYLNIATNDKNICRIYDLLVKLNIIDIKKKEELDLNEQKMGNIYEIFIDINNLSKELIIYSIYDVVYLIDIYIELKHQILKINPKDYYLLVDCIRFCLMEKRNITIIGDDLTLINSMNNYFFYIKKSNNILNNLLSNNLDENYYHKIKLFDASKTITNDFLDAYEYVKIITNINYIKMNILNLFRMINYVNIIKYYRVKASNTQVVEYDLLDKYKLIINEIEYLGLNHLLELTKNFYEFSDIKLKP
jgi:hypothetical protein